MTLLNYPKLLAHRGAYEHSTENTLLAMEHAAQLKCEWVEFDVRLSKDGHVMVFHDNDLKRLTNKPQLFADLTLKELKALTLAGPSQQTIPTLEEMLAELNQLSIKANIEIKADHKDISLLTQKTYEVLKRSPLYQQQGILVSSFSWKALKEMRKQDANLPLALIYNKRLLKLSWWRKCILRKLHKINAAALHMGREVITHQVIQDIHNANFYAGCYVVDKLEEAKYLAELGVDGFFTTYPARLQPLFHGTHRSRTNLSTQQ